MGRSKNPTTGLRLTLGLPSALELALEKPPGQMEDQLLGKVTMEAKGGREQTFSGVKCLGESIPSSTAWQPL